MKFLLLLSGLFLLASLLLIITSPYYIFTIHSRLLLLILTNYLASCSSQNLKGYETWALSTSLLTHLNSSIYLPTIYFFLHTYSFFFCVCLKRRCPISPSRQIFTDVNNFIPLPLYLGSYLIKDDNPFLLNFALFFSAYLFQFKDIFLIIYSSQSIILALPKSLKEQTISLFPF